MEAKATCFLMLAQAGGQQDVTRCLDGMLHPVVRDAFDETGTPLLEDTMARVGTILAARGNCRDSVSLWRRAAHMHWARNRPWPASDLLLKAALLEGSRPSFLNAAHMCVCAGRWQVAGLLCFAAYVCDMEVLPPHFQRATLDEVSVTGVDVGRFRADAEVLQQLFRGRGGAKSQDAVGDRMDRIEEKYRDCIVLSPVLARARTKLGTAVIG